MVDSYSGYLDFKKLNSQYSTEVIGKLQEWFSVHGIPEILESDNGPQFSSREFKQFAKEWNFEHRTSSPYFPRANGLAERAVQTTKLILKKCSKDNSNTYIALLNWRNTPKQDQLSSPNQRLMSRITRSILPISKELLKPKVENDVTKNLQRARDKQKTYADQGSQNTIPIEVNDRVRIRMNPRDWVTGRVIENSVAPKSVIVKTDNNEIYRRNWHHVNKTNANIPIPEQLLDDFETNKPTIDGKNSDGIEKSDHKIQSEVGGESREGDNEKGSPKVRITRSGRIIKPPERLDI